MDYLSLLKTKKAEKTALIAKGVSFTYGDLVREAAAIRNRAGAVIRVERKVRFISQEKIRCQLLEFLAFSGTEEVPVIATAASAGEVFDGIRIPPATCMWVMTSGSTGKSRLLWRSYGSWADFFACQNYVFGITVDTDIFCQGSLAFTGNLSIYIGVFAAGGTVIAAEKFRQRHWLEEKKKYEVDAGYLIPSKLMLLPRVMKKENNSIKNIITCSQSMELPEAERLKTFFPEAEITLYYWASEVNYITYIKGRDMTRDRTIIGRSSPGVAISVKGEEIFVTNNSGVEGIKTHFSLKDRGYLDDEGNLHFLGRKDGMLSINGIKVSAWKVENALLETLQCTDAAVILLQTGNADTLTACIAGERVPKAKLLCLLRQHLEDYKMPKQFIFMDAIPKNESGKANRGNPRQVMDCQ
ncbi:MAG: AMP-binding protein [Phascolarctobacterium sp.]|nr:AMP-binding protein [Phascolarctobacterium sp.]